MDKKCREYMTAGAVCVILFVVLSNLGKILSGIGSFFSIFSSVFIGAVVAYILNPLAVWVEKKLLPKISKDSLRWILSVIVTLLIVLVFFAIILYMLIPQMVNSISSLVNNLDYYTENLLQKTESLTGVYKTVAEHFVDHFVGNDGTPTKLMSLIVDNLNSLLTKTSTFGAKAVNTVIGIVLAVYFLLSKHSIIGTFSNFFSVAISPLKYYRSKLVVEKFNSIFSTYIVCELLDALIIGVLNMIFMLITGMPYVVFISVIVAVTNLAPTFGPIIGAVISGIVLLLISPAAVLPFLIFTAVLQMSDGYLIKPKLFGGALNVPAVLILVSIIVFGKLMGVTGMLIAIPCAAIIAFFFNEQLIPWLELRRDVKRYSKEMQAEAAKHASADEKPEK